MNVKHSAKVMKREMGQMQQFQRDCLGTIYLLLLFSTSEENKAIYMGNNDYGELARLLSGCFFKFVQGSKENIGKKTL